MTKREKCNAIKEARKKFVELEGLDVAISDCRHEGECPPDCSFCEEELKDISNAIERKTVSNLRRLNNEFQCDYEFSIEGLLAYDGDIMEEVSIKPKYDEYDMLNSELEDIGLSEYTF